MRRSTATPRKWARLERHEQGKSAVAGSPGRQGKPKATRTEQGRSIVSRRQECYILAGSTYALGHGSAVQVRSKMLGPTAPVLCQISTEANSGCIAAV